MGSTTTIEPQPEEFRSHQGSFGWNRLPPRGSGRLGQNPVSVCPGDQRDLEQVMVSLSAILPRPRTGPGKEARHHRRENRRFPGLILLVTYRVICAQESGLEAGVIPRVSFPPGQVAEPVLAEVDP